MMKERVHSKQEIQSNNWQEIKIFKSFLIFNLVLKKDFEKKCVKNSTFSKLPETRP